MFHLARSLSTSKKSIVLSKIWMEQYTKIHGAASDQGRSSDNCFDHNKTFVSMEKNE